MLEKGLDLRATVEILNIEERMPKDHLLRKIDQCGLTTSTTWCERGTARKILSKIH